MGLWWAGMAVVAALVLHAGGPLVAEDRRPTPDQASFVDRYLDVAEEIDASLGDQLRSMCQRDPERFGRVLRQLGPTLAELADLKETNPELFWRKIRELHLEASIESLAASIRSTEARTGGDAAAERLQLRGLVEAQMGAELRTRADVLAQMRIELAAAEADLAKETADFEGAVQRRIEMLLGVKTRSQQH